MGELSAAARKPCGGKPERLALPALKSLTQTIEKLEDDTERVHRYEERCARAKLLRAARMVSVVSAFSAVLPEQPGGPFPSLHAPPPLADVIVASEAELDVDLAVSVQAPGSTGPPAAAKKAPEARQKLQAPTSRRSRGAHGGQEGSAASAPASRLPSPSPWRRNSSPAPSTQRPGSSLSARQAAEEPRRRSVASLSPREPAAPALPQLRSRRGKRRSAGSGSAPKEQAAAAMMRGEGPELTDSRREVFLHDVFREYATEVDSRGFPLLLEESLWHLLGDFTGMPQDPAVVAGANSYAERIAAQEATPTELNVAPADARRGLSMRSCRLILETVEEQWPDGLMTKVISARHFLCSGDAALLVRAMNGNRGRKIKSVWVP
mmetsp:Transcript_19547/g.62049  ORF Transcript_19547/g.62049 Transcript_19547/m.62049 type:complete len:379 (+) Transcript_19547:139-1275(+)